MTHTPARLGIVGCGGISNTHARAASNIPQKVKFVACCDIREEVARTWADRYGCDEVYTDYEEMIRRVELDGVLLATWPTQHREQIEKCLAAGVRNILCEKALTMTGEEADEIWRLAEEHDAFLMEGFMYRHHPAVRKLERLLSHGELGRVDNVRGVFSVFDAEELPVTDTTRNWRQRKECGGGVPHDFACYPINACGHFAGDLPVRVSALGGVSEKYDIVDRLYGVIEYANGCVGMVESSKKADFKSELQVSCERGILTLSMPWTAFEELTVTHHHSHEWAKVLVDSYSIPKRDYYQLQLENFADVIRGEATPGMPLIQSVVNTFTTEALVKSLLGKQTVEVKIPDAVSSRYEEYAGGSR